MKRLLFTLASILSCSTLFAQYTFTDKIDLERTEIKNQEATGTCWSFATTSFIESEVLRMSKKKIDLSEMYNVRKIYCDKAQNYVLRQGKANFSEGSLAHDVLRTVSAHGLMPQEAFTGLADGVVKLNHGELSHGLKGYLDGVLDNRKPTKQWSAAVDGILDAYMGPLNENFTYEGKSYTPQTFAQSLGIKSEDYVNLSSFSHHDFYKSFILEVPDNYSNGSFQNLPLDEFTKAVDAALAAGFSLAWDGDVSEKGFSARQGIAVLPVDAKREDLFENPREELKVDQASRQVAFESFKTTDDHLMHVVGKAVDQKGNNYYIIKNSWGDIGPYSGYIYMSEAYFKMKTVSVTVHKDALSKTLAKKLAL